MPEETHKHTHMVEGNISALTSADELAGSESLSYFFNDEVSSFYTQFISKFYLFIYFKKISFAVIV